MAIITDLFDNDIIIEPISKEEVSTPGPGNYGNAHDNQLDVQDWRQRLEEEGPEFALQYWARHIRYAFAHREKPIELFETEHVKKEGIEALVAKRMEYGNLDRPVLKRSDGFEQNAKHVGEAISLQYAVDSTKSPEEVAEEIPYSFSVESIQRVREVLEECDAVWIRHVDAMSDYAKTPISKSTQLDGMLYYMYTQNHVGSPLPLYIGMSQKMGQDGEDLNWNFSNITQDSVFGRWGYGSSQHLGELSRAMFPEAYDSEPKPKYKEWRDELFVDQTPVLRGPVYIEMIPYFDADIRKAEEIMIRVASKVWNHPSVDSDEFGYTLLNKEYT